MNSNPTLRLALSRWHHRLVSTLQAIALLWTLGEIMLSLFLLEPMPSLGWAAGLFFGIALYRKTLEIMRPGPLLRHAMRSSAELSAA